MSNRPLVGLSLAAILLAGCRSHAELPPPEATASSDTASPARVYSVENCPVTRPPDSPFVPPSPWPAQPPGAHEFWFGSAGLWTALPNSGAWRQLAIGEKFWWWSERYSTSDVAKDHPPDLVVSASPLGTLASTFHTSQATNGFHSSFNQAMLVGVTLPSSGCWQFEAEFMGSQLSFILWVPPQ